MLGGHRVAYKLKYSTQAEKDARLLEQAGLDDKARELLAIIEQNPYQTPPPYEKLSGDLRGFYSRRINKKHRIVYAVLPNSENLKDENDEPYKGIAKILRMWTHYE
jgi:Txe/YoeB family toxin of toxin-antitoxin system